MRLGVGYLLFVWCEVAWFGGFSGGVGFGGLDGLGAGRCGVCCLFLGWVVFWRCFVVIFAFVVL